MDPRQKRRLELLRKYGKLYRRHYDAGSESCFYCGDVRQCLDHRPALVVLESVEVRQLKRAKIPLVVLPCCMSCNRTLGERPILTALEACEYLRSKLEKKYEKTHVIWTEDEIQELSPLFKKIAKSTKYQAQLLRDRVVFAQKRCIDFELMPEYLPYLDDDDEKTL